MIVVRPIAKKDTEIFIELAFTANIGMTSLPKNREILEKKVSDSENAFAKNTMSPQNENYLFVLEDLATGMIGGTCGINSKTGIDQTKYFYRIETAPAESSRFPNQPPIPLMKVAKYTEAPSEICSLYLFPEFRREGLGRLLSLSRFLFIASFLNRFDQVVYAEMRGYVDKNQNCPFWEGIGRHFLNIEYVELIRLRDLGNFNIQQVLPTYPIYISLLPKEVQDVIGKVHSNTWPAFNMLTQEGFYQTNEIDVFDAGPKVEAKIKDIRSIKSSIQSTVSKIIYSPIKSPRYILSNDRLDFRSCYSFLQEDPSGIAIPADIAKALQLKVGDSVRYIIPPSITSEISLHNHSKETLS